MNTRIMKTIAIAASAGLFLAACADTDDTVADDPGTVTTTATTPGASPVETTMTTADTDPQIEGEDPVFRVIDAVLAEYSDGIIVDIDREDDADSFEIDVVQGEDLIELQVDFDGALREDDREGDGEQVLRAQDATVTAEDAIQQALELHPEGLLDEAELDEEDGTLQWRISLDDADRNDLAEVDIAAN
ncbi:hypothetical protein EAH68_11425 [Corynebacterium hylobatis]|uniref:PepSY domain-containing protein n=1 Tax=Corynebacterium hylobatis TaxID=1859290 RepID=A0A3S0HFR2_9CORY|nr:PepSY domain-containing protein [Corynebacterium hylobatis]RSZ61687.1 hypothetical protein EAH68_11425 [Corynebacterium hylobatis]